MVPLERNLYGHPLAGLSWERQFEEVVLELGWRKVPNLFTAEQGLFLSENVDDIKMAGMKQNMAPFVEIFCVIFFLVLRKMDLDEPTSFLDLENLGCTQSECIPNKVVMEERREMFESRISAGATEKLPGWEELHAKSVAWSHNVEGHAPNAPKVEEKWCQRISCLTEGVYSIGLRVSRFSSENIFYVTRETWEQNAPSHSPRAPGTK